MVVSYEAFPVQFGETAAHRAAFLGLAETISILRYHEADFSIPDNDGLSACDLAETSCNGECYANATVTEPPPPPSPAPPPPPPLVKEVKGSPASLLTSSSV